MTNYEKMFKQLFMLNQGRVYLHLADGHTWIENEEGSLIDHDLRKNGISVNNKIYGGLAQALDTMDEALQQAGYKPLVQEFDALFFVDAFYRVGAGGVDESRIHKTTKGKGGLY